MCIDVIIITMTVIIKEEEVINLRGSWGHGRKWRGTRKAEWK